MTSLIRIAIVMAIVIIIGIMLSGCAQRQDTAPNYTTMNNVMRQQQVLNSLEIYNRMASPCGINTPCRRW